MPGIGVGNGVGVQRRSQGIPFASDLNFRSVGRSELDLIDFYGNNQKILPSHAYINGTSHFYRAGISVGTNDASGFIKAKVYVDQVNEVQILSTSTTTTTSRYIYFKVQSDGKLVFFLREPGANPVVFSAAYRTTNALSVGWHEVEVRTGTTSYELYVDNILTPSGYVTGSGNKWFADVAEIFRKNIGIGVRIEGSVTKIDTASKIAWVNYNDTHRWILHGQGLYALDNIGNVDIQWVGTPSYKYDENASTFLLDNGYSVFTKEGELNEYLPNASLDVISPTANHTAFLSTYTRAIDMNGNSVNHNLAPSVIDFDYNDSGLLANFDRSNATIYSVDARTGHDYDAANPFQWKAEDITNPKFYYDVRNIGYKGSLMTKTNNEDEIVLNNLEILSYNTDKINSAGFKVAKYCLIDDYFIKENGIPVYDGNGYMTFLTDFITANNFLVSPTITKSFVFEPGVDFIAQNGKFRVPFCEVTNTGTIIAGTRIGYGTSSDYAKTDTGIKRSVNGGVTWLAEQIIMANNEIDSKSRKGNAAILVNRNTNRIFIFTDSVDNYTETGVSGVVFDPPLIWDFIYKYSDDDGATWSSEISLKHLNGSGSNIMIPGSSNKGVTLSNGTIVMPIYEGRQSTNQIEDSGVDWQTMAGFIYSTDNGDTWLKSNMVQNPISESSLIEYAPNKLMLFGRAYLNHKRVYKTDDLGTTWVEHSGDRSLSGTPTEMGTIQFNNTFLISCPANQVDRSQITLHRSKSYRSFMPFLLLDADLTYGYTCICRNGDNLYLIYEKNTGTYFVDLSGYVKYLK